MTKSDLGRTVVALVCTLVASASLVAGAVAPADASRAPTPIQAARTLA